MTSSSYTCYHCGYVAKDTVDWVEHLNSINHLTAYQQKINQTPPPGAIKPLDIELVIHLMQLGFVTIVDELRRRLL